MRFDNVCGALQAFTEELLCEWVSAAIKKTGVHKVVGAGGVFMNVKANKRIAELAEVEYFDVFPSCGDESLPFGALWLEAASESPGNQGKLGLPHYYLGPSPSYDLNDAKAKFRDQVVVEEPVDLQQRVVELLAAGEVVGRCAGPMEFGARALGNRSLLADPAKFEVVPRINAMIKRRDFWMPFAPAMRLEDAETYVDLPTTLPNHRSAYMMHTFASTDQRTAFPAACHQHDWTARAQIVSEAINPEFHRLLSAFKSHAHRGVLLNTSFNLHGFPIVMGACDAVDVFVRSGLQRLIVDNCLFSKPDTCS